MATPQSAVAQSRNLGRDDYPEKHPPTVAQPMPPAPPGEEHHTPLTGTPAEAPIGEGTRWTTGEFDGADECLPTFVMAWVRAACGLRFPTHEPTNPRTHNPTAAPALPVLLSGADRRADPHVQKQELNRRVLDRGGLLWNMLCPVRDLPGPLRQVTYLLKPLTLALWTKCTPLHSTPLDVKPLHSTPRHSTLHDETHHHHHHHVGQYPRSQPFFFVTLSLPSLRQWVYIHVSVLASLSCHGALQLFGTHPVNRPNQLPATTRDVAVAAAAAAATAAAATAPPRFAPSVMHWLK